MRAAVIGCGTVSYAHLWSYRSLDPLVTLVAAADPVDENRSARQREYDIPQVYADAAHMLEQESPDLVSICTPPQSHRDLVELAARSGARGILCEKPMALSAPDAAAMVWICREHDVRLALGYQLRSQLVHRQAAALVADGAVGRPTFARAICHGSMISVGTHTFDLLCFLMGDPTIEWVAGQAQFGESPHGERGFAEESVSVGYYRFASGMSALFEGGEAATAFHHVYLEGTEGRVEIRPFDDPGARYRRQSDDAWTLVPPCADPTIPPLPAGIPPLPEDRPGWDRDAATAAYPFRLELLELVRCVEEGRDHRASGERGLASFEAVLGLYESARQQARIRLPLA